LVVPSCVLTPHEVEILFKTLRKLTSEGVAILYISHKLEEIRALCESATILRLGKKVGTCVPRDVSAREMAEMMVGSQLHVPERTGGDLGPVLLELTDLSVKSPSEFGTSLKGITLKVRSGEVLGLGGVAGNGQDELLAALSGEIRSPAGAVIMESQSIGALGPTARRKLGLLTAPEERLGHAAAPDMSLTENALLTASVRQGLENKGFLNWGKTREFAEAVIERFDVRTPGPANAARSLSGGNLQKFVIGREVMQLPTVLVVNQPTWGVDAAAAASIRQALLDLAAGGTAVIVISQDLDELMEISDHFGALNEGRLSDIRPARGLSVDEIGLMMGGAHGMEEAHV
jgi:simple sugar transport system ATP-binding protein